MKKLNADYLSIGKVSLLLEVSDHTITRWYKWWESERFEKPEDLYLPPYYHKDRRRTKFFKKEDIKYLEEFKLKMSSTHKGCMADFNAAYQWGKRGVKALENKGLTVKDVQRKMR